MTTVKWFGISWGAPVCDPEDHVETPVGRPCMRCTKAIGENDQGLTIPHVRERERKVSDEPWHLGCYLESILPCPGCKHCKPEAYS